MIENPREHKVARDGLDVRYSAYGGGQPVVILSGGPGFDCDYMQPVAWELAKSYRAILVDLRGTGRSVPASINHETTNLKLTLEDLEAIRETIGVEYWTVLGHSAGAVLAMAYATRYPERIRSLVLAHSGPIRAASASAEIDNLTMRLTAHEREEMSKVDGQNFGQLLKFLLPGYFYDRSHADAVRGALAPAKFHNDTAHLLAADLYAGEGDLRPGLADFAGPALIIAGRQDPCDPAMQYEIHLTLKNSTLQFLDRCGHFAWIEQPAAFYRALFEFLAAHA